jgi:hypothetical protein
LEVKRSIASGMPTGLFMAWRKAGGSRYTFTGRSIRYITNDEVADEVAGEVDKLFCEVVRFLKLQCEVAGEF